MWELLKNSSENRIVKRPGSIEYHCIFDTVAETGAHHFLHGVAVEQWQGRLAACFAFNDYAENSITEKLIIRWSDDGGKTWTAPEAIAQSDDCAHSHGVFLSQEDALWCFAPHFLGLGKAVPTSKGHVPIHFQALQMEAWRYDGDAWQSRGIVAEGFWPLGAPALMENGCWLLSGCDTNWMGTVAISRGDDLTRWDIVKPETEGEVLTEAGAWAAGSNVFMVLRNQTVMTDGKFHAAFALSQDYGKTFSPCGLTNLPMATTKPFCGCLNDGRPYLIFNESVPGDPHCRSRMLLGIGEKGAFQISKLYLIDEGQPTDGGRRLALSYPYACQIGNRLHIAYSSESAPGKYANNNDAMLAIVDLDLLV